MEEDNLEGWFTNQPKTLLRSCLELLCCFKTDTIKEDCIRLLNEFISIKANGWGHKLALSVLIEYAFFERMQFKRITHVQNTVELSEAFLELSETVQDKFPLERAQIMNLLSDLSHFQGGEKGEENALKWAIRCLEINPEDQFAKMQKKFIEERQMVEKQIDRFDHDTNNAIIGIRSTLDLIFALPQKMGKNLEQHLKTILVEINRIYGVNRFIQDQQPEWQDFNPVELIKEISISFSQLAKISITPENTLIEWDSDPDYLRLAVYNLFKNSIEAFNRNNILESERKITIKIIPEKSILFIEDNAGGINPKLKNRIFQVYTSSKGTQRSTGLGLSQAKKAVEKMLEGKLFLSETQPKNGAKFEIHL